ncbi:MAG TPA: Co2+/Mg2+ efflux protein ApaG [bacterium]|nr:Co2+/Mg2+ efflux protein ApaG [bacterium]
MSEAITRGVKVEVESEYSEERSNPDGGVYFFVYHVVVTNVGEETVRLISRHWIITNADGKKEEVRGPGVVGEQPTLKPGESFEYSSFCPLSTPFGMMHGTYQMVTDAGEEFDAQIAPFTLSREEVMYH